MRCIFNVTGGSKKELMVRTQNQDYLQKWGERQQSANFGGQSIDWGNLYKNIKEFENLWGVIKFFGNLGRKKKEILDMEGDSNNLKI